MIGMSFMLNRRPVIFVSSNVSRARQRFTTAHELGHILLGHVGRYKLVNREPDPRDTPIEQAANVFASRLLAPPVCFGAAGRGHRKILWNCATSADKRQSSARPEWKN